MEHLDSKSGGWEVAPIALKVRGPDGVPADFIVAGWRKGLFGLDFRVFDDGDGEFAQGGFILTHIPTGYVVRQIVGVGTTRAKELADEIAESANWDFTGAPTQQCKTAIAELIAKHSEVLASGHLLIGPAI